MTARCAYVILCHTDPQGVLRLVRRIRRLSPGAPILVRHHRASLFASGDIESAGGVSYRSDVAVEWGDWSMVEMQIDALRAARRIVPAARYVVVSGQDYPVRDLEAWEDELAAEGADMLLDPMSAQPRNHEFVWRVIGEPARTPRLIHALSRTLANTVSALAGDHLEIYPVTREMRTRWWVGTRRRETPPLPIVKASAWTTLSDRAVAAVLRAGEDPEITSFFKTVRNPDEFFVSSVLVASGLRTSIRRTTAKRFAVGAPGPDWVDLDLVEAAATSDAAFVRKMPPNVDPVVVSAADALVDLERARRVAD
ncbi:beta-1,6-N-acetylglucosaminyltransferase [Agilicoccus flavus]|uniref:beta-1,6-N-acetylglucosaminyltransferase n=1 Tax=Agilicoccus flavus TaxID=2775968 RepID=UPI001CF6C380|nr:beta-1,6-N-acetylglucosaminyltransferase [Agilicoccus flavus]